MLATSYASATDYAPAYASTNTSAYASGYVPAHASDNVSVYAPIYAFATGYEPATNYASESGSASTPTRTSRFETTVLD